MSVCVCVCMCSGDSVIITNQGRNHSNQSKVSFIVLSTRIRIGNWQACARSGRQLKGTLFSCAQQSRRC